MDRAQRLELLVRGGCLSVVVVWPWFFVRGSRLSLVVLSVVVVCPWSFFLSMIVVCPLKLYVRGSYVPVRSKPVRREKTNSVEASVERSFTYGFPERPWAANTPIILTWPEGAIGRMMKK